MSNPVTRPSLSILNVTRTGSSVAKKSSKLSGRIRSFGRAQSAGDSIVRKLFSRATVKIPSPCASYRPAYLSSSDESIGISLCLVLVGFANGELGRSK